MPADMIVNVVMFEHEAGDQGFSWYISEDYAREVYTEEQSRHSRRDGRTMILLASVAVPRDIYKSRGGSAVTEWLEANLPPMEELWPSAIAKSTVGPVVPDMHPVAAGTCPSCRCALERDDGRVQDDVLVYRVNCPNCCWAGVELHTFQFAGQAYIEGDLE